MAGSRWRAIDFQRARLNLSVTVRPEFTERGWQSVTMVDLLEAFESSHH